MQIPVGVLTSVAFLYSNRKSGMEPRGTVFFVGYEIPGTVEQHVIFAVTCRHVVEGYKDRTIDGKTYFRINDKRTGFTWGSIELSDWIFHEDPRVDVAVATVGFTSDTHEQTVVPISGFLAKERIQEEMIGPGDDLFFPGLFAPHPGKGKNIPIIRTGTIAAMPDEPIATEGGFARAYLVEARSIGGLSGSPVFLHPGYIRQIVSQEALRFGPTRFPLLGMVRSHFDVKDELDSHEDAAEINFSRSVNRGIAVVVPAEDIRSVIDTNEVLITHRRMVTDKVLEHLAQQKEVNPGQA